MRKVPLGELCEIIIGRTPPRAEPSYWGSGEPWLSIADMNQGKVISRTKEQISPAGASLGKQVSEGTVLLSFKLSIGKVAIAGMPLYTNEAIAALPIRDRQLLTESYLVRALESVDLADGSNRAAMGATLNNAGLRDVRVPLPPIAEQRRIATILDQADALRAKRRQVLAHLDDLPQAIFHAMFGDPDESASNVYFGDLATLSGGRNLVAHDSAAPSRYRVLKISAVTTGQFRPQESKPLPPTYVPPNEHLVKGGDLLMSRANTTELVGAVAYVSSTPANLALPDKVWRFDWKTEAEPAFYHALLSTSAMKRRISRLSSGTGGSMKNVSKAKLNGMLVPHVELGQQRAFVERARRVSDQRAAVQRAVSADDELFASLQSRAFRGEL